MHDLGSLTGSTGDSTGCAINDSNWVAGFSPDSGGAVHAVVWDNTGAITDLGPGIAFGINSSNQVVGISFTVDGDRAFSWTSGGGMVTLDVPTDAKATYAFGLNDSGEIVGAALF
jgi:probable HAF family extracellular repeat protein